VRGEGNDWTRIRATLSFCVCNGVCTPVHANEQIRQKCDLVPFDFQFGTRRPEKWRLLLVGDSEACPETQTALQISAEEQSNALVSGSTFSSCRAGRSGGAISIRDSDPTASAAASNRISGCTFTGNQARFPPGVSFWRRREF